MSVNGAGWKKSFDNEDGPVIKGRKYHNVKESSYWLPKDEDEQVRLNGLHFAFKKMFDGNLFPEAYEFTNFEEGVKCLDIGCGPGSFIMDMAMEYPNSHFYGIDIAAMFDSQVKLPNTEFSLGNILTGLPFPDNSIDFVHMRLLMAAFRRDEWPIALKEIFRVLKPGGGVQLCEFMESYNGNDNTKEVQRKMYDMLRKHGQVAEAGSLIETWLKEAGFNSTKADIRSADVGEDNSYSKQWMWVWEQSLRATFPVLAPSFGIEGEEQSEEFLKAHFAEMAENHGFIAFTRVIGRKPIE